MLAIMNAAVAAIDGALERARGLLSEPLFLRLEAGFMQIGALSTLAAAAFGMLLALIIAVKEDSLSLFLAGGAWVVGVVVMYYVGTKLLRSCDTTIANNPSNIGSRELLDVVALFGLLGSVATVLAGIYFSVKYSSLTALWIALGAAAVQLYIAWVALSPGLIGIYVKPAASAGIDAIAILMLTNKIYLRAARVVFGLGALIGAGLMAFSLQKAFGHMEELWLSGISGVIGFAVVAGSLLAPLAFYLFFVLGYLLLDVLRSILVLPTIVGGGASNGGAEVAPPTSPAAMPAVLPPSPEAVRKTLIGLVALVVAVGAVVQGKTWWREYQVKREQQRIEEAQRKAEEEARAKAEAEEQERLKAERARTEALVSAARKHVQGNALDLLLEPEVNKAFRPLFGDKMSVFETYFTQPEAVAEVDGLIVGSGCRKEECEAFRAMVVVDTKTGQAMAVAVSNGNIKYFGVSEADAPPVMRKWALSQSN